MSLALPTSSNASCSGGAVGGVEPIQTANFDQELGMSIIRHALSQPAHMILTNW